MSRNFEIKSLLASNAHVDLDDSLQTKVALRWLGYYSIPSYGMTPYPDRQLFDALSDLQKDKGMRRTGEMRPGDETEKAIRVALNAKSPNASESLKRKGKYIWRTRGDSKVRSEHADRDGKTYSWNDPPEGGHPGEAPNCRCRAEEVDGKDELCQKLQFDIRLQINEVDSLRKELDGLRGNYVQHAQDFVDAENVLLELITEAAIPDIPDNVFNIREYLKKILKAVGATYMLLDLADAWHSRREARRNMEGAQKIYENGMSKFESATKKLSTLHHEHQENCD